MTTSVSCFRPPRRRELLTQLGFSFEQVVPGIEEQRRAQESAQQYVVPWLAREKAAGVALVPRDPPVLGAMINVKRRGAGKAARRSCRRNAAFAFRKYASGDDCCCA